LPRKRDIFDLPRDANRPWNLVTVNKPPRRIKLGGFLPHCGEVCGEYAIVEEVWGSTDRPLYVQVRKMLFYVCIYV
jgi:hypothetical protein